jgi:hypothetical protein
VTSGSHSIDFIFSYKRTIGTQKSKSLLFVNYPERCQIISRSEAIEGEFYVWSFFFTRVRNPAEPLLKSLHPSLRPSDRTHEITRDPLIFFVKFDIGEISQDVSTHSCFRQNWQKIKDTLHEYVHAFVRNFQA